MEKKKPHSIDNYKASSVLVKCPGLDYSRDPYEMAYPKPMQRCSAAGIIVFPLRQTSLPRYKTIMPCQLR